VPNSNGGQELPANSLFGKLVLDTPIVPPAQTARTSFVGNDTMNAVPLAVETLATTSEHE